MSRFTHLYWRYKITHRSQLLDFSQLIELISETSSIMGNDSQFEATGDDERLDVECHSTEIVIFTRGVMTGLIVVSVAMMREMSHGTDMTRRHTLLDDRYVGWDWVGEGMWGFRFVVVMVEVIQAYNATSNESPIPLPQAPIAPPTIFPLPLVLPSSPLFDPPNFFLPEEILPPQKRVQRHEGQIETILNHLDELPLERIKHMEDKIEGLGNSQREQIRHNDEIILARVKISTLEMIIKDIQVIDVSYLYVSGITMVLLPSGFLEPLFPGIMDMINNHDIEHMIPPTPPRDIEPIVGSPILLSPFSSVGFSSPIRSTTPPPDYPFDETIFAELDNSLWIIPLPLGSEPVLEKPNELDAC
ncbi:hypothetical protein Tco_0873457 [Tanacetum coccineum]|uniref:Uncharacterized protein n=1 Tax=Tanacetum coccineum TaxID=301880 RepID=A0ABQ5BIU3_9ASTR